MYSSSIKVQNRRRKKDLQNPDPINCRSVYVGRHDLGSDAEAVSESGNKCVKATEVQIGALSLGP